jgi:Ca-activated chloride channel family protein
LSHVSIRIQSTGYLYFTGSEGAFGIPLNKLTDTLLVTLDGYQSQKVPLAGQADITIQLKKAPYSRSRHVNRLASLTQNLKRDVQQQWFLGDETYASLVENGFINAQQYPATGLTLNVDRASYSNIRRFLSMNTQVPPDAVRIEEMLNYFNFNYEEPPGGKTFGLGSLVTQCPWNRNNLLLFTRVVSRKINSEKLPASHLVFLIDVSGSMDMPNRLPLLKNGFKALVNNLRPVDSVSIVVYGGTVGIALPTTGGDEKEYILKVIDSLQAGGSTPGESGIKLAYSIARNHFIEGGNNRIILATDGDFNVGLRKEEELEEMIIAQRERGIYLTCLGIGMGNYKDSKIQTLAQKGNGNFAYLDSYAEAEKVLLKEFTQTLFTVADDASLNVRFNPKYVREYRLLGFDNKVGAIKDTGSVIEGGEIGSAYSSLIAFEIQPVQPVAELLGKTLGDTLLSYLLHYRLPGDTAMHRMTETPEVQVVPFLQAPAHYQFASAVIMFGGLLRQSRYIKDVNWNSILQVATAAVDPQSFSQKEFLLLVQHARNVYGKKRKKGAGD